MGKGKGGKSMKKRLLAIVLAASTALLAIGCATTGSSKATASTGSSSAASPASSTASSAAAETASSTAASTSSSASTSSTDDVTVGNWDATYDNVDKMVINLYNPVAGEVTDQSYQIFAENVEKMSKGAITCNITPAGSIGKEREATQLLLAGEIDGGVFSIDGLDWLVPDVGMYWVSLPGFINSYDEVDSIYNNGWYFQRHKEVAAAAGVDVVCPGEFGLKVFEGTGSPIRTFDDFKGKVIRVPDIQMNHDYIEALGATSVSGIDMYTGLQQGTMDAVQNNIPASALFKLEEVVTWVTLTWDIYGTNYWVFNKDFTDKCSDVQKEIIYASAKKAAKYIREQYRQINDQWVQECRDNPKIEVIDIDDTFKAKLKEVAYKVWEKERDTLDPVAMDQIFKDFYPAGLSSAS